MKTVIMDVKDKIKNAYIFIIFYFRIITYFLVLWVIHTNNEFFQLCSETKQAHKIETSYCLISALYVFCVIIVCIRYERKD